MTDFALIDLGNGGNIIGSASTVAGARPPTPFGSRRWIVNSPPVTDINHMAVVAYPIASDAVQVPYNIVPFARDLSRDNTRAITQRRAEALLAAGEELKALLLLKTIGE